MSTATSIEWTDVTWNPVRGCARVSSGCEHCYAERVAYRFGQKPDSPYEGLTMLGKRGPRWAGRARFVPAMLGAPLRWRKPRRVFVNSMSDLFHEDIQDQQIAAVFGVMAACPQHTFQVLTKRPDRMAQWFAWHAQQVRSRHGGYWEPWRVCESEAVEYLPELPATGCLSEWPLSNVWLGVSCESQRTAAERVPQLLRCEASVRFVSAEPLLEHVSLRGLHNWAHGSCRARASGPGSSPRRIDWVIVGGESGPGARPCNLDWIRSIVQQCAAARVPCFVKQLGARPVLSLDAADVPGVGGDGCPSGPSRDSKHGDLSKWPADLRVRQFPDGHLARTTVSGALEPPTLNQITKMEQRDGT